MLLLSSLVLAGAAPWQRRTPEERLAALEARLDALQQSQDEVRGRLEQMRLDLDNTLEPLRVRLADQGEDLRGFEGRLVALEEQLVLMNERLLQISEALAGGAGARGSGDATGTPMPPPQRPAGVPGPSVAAPAGRAPPAAAATSEAESLYSAAYTDYLAANYPLAISGFEEYLRLFPSSDLADNAQYWIGESLFSQQQYSLARTAFREVARRYPEAETVPDARFKAARCLVETGERQRAVDELVSLVRDHPLSDTVPIACLQIERLGAQKPLGCPEG
jgi:tol-pal system protein YbgF